MVEGDVVRKKVFFFLAVLSTLVKIVGGISLTKGRIVFVLCL